MESLKTRWEERKSWNHSLEAIQVDSKGRTALVRLLRIRRNDVMARV